MTVKKIKLFDVAVLFAILFAILPSYFQIGGISIFYLVALMLITCRCLSCGLTCKVRRFPGIALIIIWTIWKSFTCVVNGAAKTGFWLFISILACGILIRSVNTEEKFFRFIDSLILLAGVVGVFGIVESITRFNAFSLLNTSGATLNYTSDRFGIIRILSYSSQTISYCLYCMLMLSIVYYRIVNGTEKKHLYQIIYTILWANAIMTLSRSAFLCIILCQFLLLWCSGYKRAVNILFRCMIVGGIVIIIGYLLGGTVRTALQSFAFMLLAVFNDSYSNVIASSFGSNLSGTGNRLELYEWVLEEVKGHALFGKGPWSNLGHFISTTNVNGYSYTWVKNSIENAYLNILYRYGIITLVIEMMVYLNFTVETLKSKMKLHFDTELRLTYSKMFGITSFCYMLSWFAVSQGAENRLFMVLASLYLVYCEMLRKQGGTHSENRNDWLYVSK